jgi:ferredoxin-NADP reductase/uncharacterized iron-regulated membrane protein
MNSILRRSSLQVHRWTGLTVGLLVVFLAITGLSLVFRPQLEPMVERDLHEVSACSSTLPIDAIVASARSAHPKVGIELVKIAEGSEPAVVRFVDKVGVHVDPCNGAVLGQQHRWAGVFNTFEQLHRFRFIESADVGNFITGSAAFVVLFAFVVGGLVVWWPATVQAFKRSFKPATHLKGRAFEVNLHRTIGLYASLVLLVVALTAMPIAFKRVRYAMYSATGSAMPAPKPQSTKLSADMKRLPLETFWQRARTLVPDPLHAVLIYPRKESDPVEISLVAQGAPHPEAISSLFLDAYSGEVLRFEPYAQSGVGNKIYRWATALHMGYVGGLFGQVLLFVGVLGVPVLAYTGTSSYLRRRFGAKPPSKMLSVRVNKIKFEAAEIKSFELVSLDGATLPSFTPGAHINVQIDQGLVRQYSLCGDLADRRRYLIAVKRVPDSRGGSQAMHERVVEGDVLSISAPRNHFPLAPRAGHHLLVAGGVGITPLLSMARHLLGTGASFELQYFARSVDDMAFHQLLSQPEFHGKVIFHYAIERHRLHEYLHRVLWQRRDGAHLYLCGPRPFMELVESTAAATWPPESIHIEYFGADPAASAGESRPFEITLARSGGSYMVPAGKSILHLLGEQGIEVPCSCEQGVCGTCLTGVLKGTPDHRDAFLSESERKTGKKIMLCVSRAKTERLVLDL